MILAAHLPLALITLLAAAHPDPPSPSPRPGTYLGVVSCASSGCHGAPAPLAAASVLMNEYDTWLHAPAPTHVRAWDALLLPRSRRIAENLRLPDPPERSSLCLDCHATNVPPALRAGEIEPTDGVSCESCHGPAGGWRAQHVQRGWSHHDSVRAGMIDLRDLPTRARTCLGCHLGDASKTVDHRLIAAGHPVLRFELDNFTESRFLPPHWRDHPERSGVRAWAVGQAVALAETAAAVERAAAGGRWPEFAFMSCSGCHHPLREGAWRQERGFAGTPGLPSWNEAHWVVFRHVVAAAAPGERAELDEEVRELAAAIASMRDPERVARRARRVRERIEPLVARIDRMRWSPERARALVAAVAADPAFETADRQAAEQAVWALLSLGGALVRDDPSLVRGELIRRIDALYRTVDSSAWPDDYPRLEFARALRGLHEQAER